MAWTAPKVDWDAPDGVAYTHLNAIGENLVVLKDHVDASTGIHGAVSAATASKLIIRDADGRAKVVAPSAEDDIALKSNVTAEATARANADGVLQGEIDDINNDFMPLAGDTFTGKANAMASPNATAQLRDIKLMTSIPGVGDLDEGQIAFVYEV